MLRTEVRWSQFSWHPRRSVTFGSARSDLLPADPGSAEHNPSRWIPRALIKIQRFILNAARRSDSLTAGTNTWCASHSKGFCRAADLRPAAQNSQVSSDDVKVQLWVWLNLTAKKRLSSIKSHSGNFQLQIVWNHEKSNVTSSLSEHFQNLSRTLRRLQPGPSCGTSSRTPADHQRPSPSVTTSTQTAFWTLNRWFLCLNRPGPRSHREHADSTWTNERLQIQKHSVWISPCSAETRRSADYSADCAEGNLQVEETRRTPARTPGSSRIHILLMDLLRTLWTLT